MHGIVFCHPPLPDFQLLDSGNGEKLERFGNRVVRRPDPQALWKPRLSAGDWGEADFSFHRESDRGGDWATHRSSPKRQWLLSKAHPSELPELKLWIKLTPFKHLGLFPEQASNWVWLEQARQEWLSDMNQPRLLNLFAYSGAASILAAKCGWKVTHVEASRPSMDWAAENAAANELDPQAIRWMLDDVPAFVAREVRRQQSYEAILLDPPHYGRGPKGEKWQFETHIATLLQNCHFLLNSTSPGLLILSTYAIGYSPLAFHNMLQDFGDLGKLDLQTGELALPEESGGRKLPCGFGARLIRHPN